jgi:hypothetical protein
MSNNDDAVINIIIAVVTIVDVLGSFLSMSKNPPPCIKFKFRVGFQIFYDTQCQEEEFH